MNKVARVLGLSLYTVFALFSALMVLVASFISDGQVPLYMRITIPLIVLILFFTPLLIWRRMNAGPVASPLPVRWQKYQDKIILGFLAVWAVSMAITYVVVRGN